MRQTLSLRSFRIFALLAGAALTAAGCDAGGGTPASALDIASIRIANPEVLVAPGEKAQIVATVQQGSSTTTPSAWATSDPAIAAVDANGTVTGVREGEATITASYGKSNGNVHVHVSTIKVASVVSTPASVTLGALGDTARLTAVAYDGTSAVMPVTIGWTALDSAVASVTADGKVTARGTGLARVVAAYSGKADTSMIQVVQVVAAVALASPAATLQVGQTVALQAAARDSGGNAIPGASFAYGSSDANVVAVDPTGAARGVASGTANVTATAGGVTASTALQVQAVQIATLAISPASVTLDPNQSQQLVAVAKDASGNVLTGRVVTWSTSNATVANVSPLGVVFALASGSATITATSEGKSASAPATVTSPSAPPSNALAFADGFESGAMAPQQSGYGWNGSNFGSGGDGVSVSTTQAHSGSHSLKFTYAGNPDPCDDAWAEQRFMFGENLTEVWLEYYLYVPAGNDGSARFYDRLPACPSLGDPNGVVTNNKFMTMWDTDYQRHDVAATFEFRRTAVGSDGDANLYGLWGTDTRPVDHNSWPGGNWDPALSDALRGKWTQIRVHVRLADSKAAANGIIQLWTDGVQRINMQNLDLAPVEGGNRFLRNGYLMGWSNTGYNATTSFFLDDFRIYHASPGW